MTGSPALSADGAVALDAALRRLHGSGDAAALSALHCKAAGMMTSNEEARFHLTHAWVYAMVAGDPFETARLERTLRDLGGL